MTDNEIRIAVAEACPQVFSLTPHHPEKIWCKTLGRFVDPLDDLNAMHAAWLTLSEADRIVFAETLFAITKGDVVDWGYYPGEMEINWDEIGTAINATARPRAEAFLRTIGKWKDEPTSSPQIQKQKP